MFLFSKPYEDSHTKKFYRISEFNTNQKTKNVIVVGLQ